MLVGHVSKLIKDSLVGVCLRQHLHLKWDNYALVIVGREEFTLFCLIKDFLINYNINLKKDTGFSHGIYSSLIKEINTFRTYKITSVIALITSSLIEGQQIEHGRNQCVFQFLVSAWSCKKCPKET